MTLPQTCRTLMKKAVLSNTDIYLALFAFRNTPSEGVNVSPTLTLFSTRTTSDFGTFNSASDLMWKSDGWSRKTKRKPEEIAIPRLIRPSTFDCWWNETSCWKHGPLHSAQNRLVHDPTKCCVVIRNTDAIDVNFGLLLKKLKTFYHQFRWRASIIWNNITGTSRGTATRVCWIACSVSKDISQCNIFAEASVPREPVEPSIGPPRARRSTRELDAYQTDCKSESRTHHI